ncbi:MAG: TIGR04086 family membrane protein [Faecalibacterium sp.]
MSKQTKSQAELFIKQGLITLLLGGGVTVGMFYFSALLIVNKMIPQSAFFVFATICICVGCAFSSMILAWQRKTGGLLAGLICFIAFAAVLIVGHVIHNGAVLSSVSVLRLILLGVSGLIGGCFGVSRGEKHVKRRHKV